MKKQMILLALLSPLVLFQNCAGFKGNQATAESQGDDTYLALGDGSDLNPGQNSDPGLPPNPQNPPGTQQPPIGAIPSNCDPADNNKYGPYPAGGEELQVKKCLYYSTAEENQYERYVLNRVRYIDMQGVERQVARVECQGSQVGALKLQRNCLESRWCEPGQDFRPGIDGSPMPCRVLNTGALIRIRP